ncbi:MAG: hypothetical protein AB7K71_40545 [Polyangiaceae bacterium]
MRSPSDEAPLYPPGPANVPKDFTRPSARYRWHARLALLALVGFVAFYFFLCFWFVRAVYRNGVLLIHGGDHALRALILLAKPAEIDTQLSKLSLEVRVSAYVVACSYLGDAAPLEWRRFAMNWLFAPERPYFSVE